MSTPISKSDARFVEALERDGTSLQTYVGLHIRQGGTCAICGKPEEAAGNNGKVKRMAIDHDHKTGEIRGLLCMKCNTALGAFDDDIDRMLRAVEYLGQDHSETLREARETAAAALSFPYKGRTR